MSGVWGGDFLVFLFTCCCCNCLVFICGDKTGGPGEFKGCLFTAVTAVELLVVAETDELTLDSDVLDEVSDSFLELGVELLLVGVACILLVLLDELLEFDC